MNGGLRSITLAGVAGAGILLRRLELFQRPHGVTNAAQAAKREKNHVTLEQMKIFMEAARFGSFTAAGEKLGLTQSAVSMAIKKIEDRNEVVLFDRSGKRLLLTEVGQTLLREVSRILSDIDLMMRRIQDHGLTKEKPTVIACSQNSYDFWMPAIISSLGDNISKAIDLIVGDADDVTAWVMRGTADIGITEFLPSHQQFRHFVIFEDRIILCGTPEKAASLPAHMDWDSLQIYAPVLWAQGDLDNLITQSLFDHGVDAYRVHHPVLRLKSTGAVLCAIEDGRFLGLVPEKAARSGLASGSLVRIGKMEASFKYWMFSLRDKQIDELAALVAKAAVA